MITLKQSEWNRLKSQLELDWPRSVMLIRSKMRDELGFTVREHKWYAEQHGYMKQICLDFYDESKETWFRLKYL